MTNEEKNQLFHIHPRDLLPQIRRLVRADLVVQEDLASDIWLYCLENQLLPNGLIIKRRCYDFLRRKRTELLANESFYSGSSAEKSSPRIVTELMESSDLTPEETRILFHRYWLGQTLLQTSESLGWSEGKIHDIQVSAELKLYFKMREKREV